MSPRCLARSSAGFARDKAASAVLPGATEGGDHTGRGAAGRSGGKKVNFLSGLVEICTVRRGCARPARRTRRTLEQGRHHMDVSFHVSLIVGPGGAGEVQAQLA